MQMSDELNVMALRKKKNLYSCLVYRPKQQTTYFLVVIIFYEIRSCNGKCVIMTIIITREMFMVGLYSAVSVNFSNYLHGLT